MDQSGAVLSEIVVSVKKVSDIVAEISNASQEQSIGIEQVNTAITKMDETTQQNAALVEEAAAAAKSLSDQARKLSDSMARFNVGEEATAPRGAVPGANPVARRSAQTAGATRRAQRTAFHRSCSPSATTIKASRSTSS